MHGIYKLKDKLCEQLEEYGQGELTMATLDVIDKLAHATKNVDKIIEAYEEQEYSEAYAGGGMSGRGSYGRFGRSYEGGRSNARRRDSRGRYSNARYSRDDMNERINGMMDGEMDEMSRAEWQSYADRMR